jgi:hypothetical protein
MPSSSVPHPAGESRLARLLRHRAVGTAALTLVLAGLLALFNWLGAIRVRGAEGIERTIPLATLWDVFFERLPRHVPGILGREPLAIGLVLATLALAYVIAATIRLPE